MNYIKENVANYKQKLNKTLSRGVHKRSIIQVITALDDA